MLWSQDSCQISILKQQNSQPKPKSGPLDKYLHNSKQSLPEDPNFKDFIAEINPEVKLPSRSTVMRDCSLLTKMVQERIKAALENAKKVSVTMDIR